MAEKRKSDNGEFFYLGPAHYLEHDGKVYEPDGEHPVPITREQALDLRARGHIIGGLENEPAQLAADQLAGTSNQKQSAALESYQRRRAADAAETASLTPAEQQLVTAADVREQQAAQEQLNS